MISPPLTTSNDISQDEMTEMRRQYGDTAGDITPRPAGRYSGERNGTKAGDEDRRIEIRKTWDEISERNEIDELMR